MLDIDKIRELIDMMKENDLVELTMRDGEEEISLRRPAAGTELTTVPIVHATTGAMPPPPLEPVSAAQPLSEEAASEDDQLVSIVSPMVGTFYSSADPDSPPFAQVGSEVRSDTVVCLLEAMKVFNEIKAEIVGTIEKILVKNEQAVEYGQQLFLVRLA